ncbi:hypothetical protein [Sphingobacterium bovistauri]|uniref:Uncharacterized protein n=1 Tax=Sphingobacterium bovistauri TaxID=2781959 RepID=A0ABS7Z6Y8_9SPHI|nr:hypothetical protein [Sphingobacterium bovistauri]MCA5005372.1 hypothetical protein [Sphingobacterium bovistauri]
MQRDSLIVGVLVGVIAPLIAYLVTVYTSFQQTYFAEKPIAFYVIAAVVNLIIVRFSFRAGNQYLAKGIVLITFLSMLLFIVLTKFKV